MTIRIRKKCFAALAQVFILLALFAFSHCGGLAEGGSELGNPEPVTLNMVGYSSSSQKAVRMLDMKRLQIQDIQVETAQIVVGWIKLRPLSACLDNSNAPDETTVEGPFVVDLLQQASVDGLQGIPVPVGTYCRIDLRLEKLESNFDPGAPIFGNSVLIQGMRSDGVPYKVKLEVDDEFYLENTTGGFEINPLILKDAFFIAFDLERWFDGVDLNAPSVEIVLDGIGDPFIPIDQDHNQALREIIIENLKLSSDLFEDKDDDGILDPAELSESLAEGKI